MQELLQRENPQVHHSFLPIPWLLRAACVEKLICSYTNCWDITAMLSIVETNNQVTTMTVVHAQVIDVVKL